MQPIQELDPATLAEVRFVLTDMDETLTLHGRLFAETYAALQALQEAGVRVVINTAAPAGWCDQMARMWPVDGVIGENGGLFFCRDGDGQLHRRFWHAATSDTQYLLTAAANAILADHSEIRVADDQAFRLSSFAFGRASVTDPMAIRDALTAQGFNSTLNNLWFLAWSGRFDKLAMARRVMFEVFAIDIDVETSQIAYVGDSENDVPMFAFFEHTSGVSNLADAPPTVLPAWITKQPGGRGFVEVANAIIQAHAGAGPCCP